MPFDYHGALVVIETERDEIIFIHPPGAPLDAPASLPSDPCATGETPEAGAVRIAREKTGLEVVITEEFVTFIQEGTPTGTMYAHGYVAHITGGSLTDDGPEGPARDYPISDPAVHRSHSCGQPEIVGCVPGPSREPSRDVSRAFTQRRAGPRLRWGEGWRFPRSRGVNA
jgi:ADP-ribose pyrophosphatase YjhB (NUDIX family)